MPAGWRLFVLALALAAIAPVRAASLHGRRKHFGRPRSTGYHLQDTYQGDSFFDNWDFFTDADPTNGQVNFLGRDDAANANLTFMTSAGQAGMRVDSTTWLGPGQPRNSVRISTQATYGDSLVVLDLAAMPHGCAVWPAFWMTSKTAQWPAGGEIDIIEGVNEEVGNHMTLHTDPGCTLDTHADFVGQTLATNCDAFADGNAGCGVLDPDPQSYGHEFNINGGSVFVTQRQAGGVAIWRFAQGQVPADLAAGNPDPSGWPAPKARWSASTCNTNQFIDGDQMLIFDITLCGDWAGAVYGSDMCPGACSDTVQNPQNFEWAHFIVNSLKVYVPN